MTREEIADKFEELARGIREGKTIQEDYAYGQWRDMKEEQVLVFGVERFRVKPEPQYIPFTADDWKEFEGKEVSSALDGAFFRVVHWDAHGVTLAGMVGDNIFCTYQQLCEEYNFGKKGLK